jgi:hypothetical protein
VFAFFFVSRNWCMLLQEIPDSWQEGKGHMRAICSLFSSEGDWSAMCNFQCPPVLVLSLDLHILMLSVRDRAGRLDPGQDLMHRTGHMRL